MGGIVLTRADENITKAQTRLRKEGCYHGKFTGVLDHNTAIALTRYQLHHGLAISGKLDAPTAKALHVSVPGVQSAPPVDPTPQLLSGSWRRLPNGELQFVGEPPPVTPSSAVAAAPPPVPLTSAPPAEGPASPALAADTRPPGLVPPANATQLSASPPAGEIDNPSRFRGYVEAFVQAGVARPQGPEIKFFADRVDYFGRPNVPREQIQRELVRYNQKWPHRTFWIEGDIQIDPQSDENEIKVVFPLRYELHHGSRYAAGKVLKSLTLLETANGEMQIIAVNEWRPQEGVGLAPGAREARDPTSQ